MGIRQHTDRDGALFETARSGKGQVIDAAMVDGAAVLSTMFHALTAMGVWQEERGKLFATMKEKGLIDLLDHHLGQGGLDVIVAPRLPEKR